MKILCEKCQSKMVKKYERSSGSWLCGLLLVILGFCMLPLFVPFGTIIGLITIYLGNKMQKGRKYYQCKKCLHIAKV